MPKHENDARPAKHDNSTKPGDHTFDVDHGVVNVVTQETRSETVTESSEQGIYDLHAKTDPEYELTCMLPFRNQSPWKIPRNQVPVLAMPKSM